MHARANTRAMPAAETHAVFSTGCSAYFDWQALGLAYSARDAGQPELHITRLVSSCPDQHARDRSMGTPHLHSFEHPDYGDGSVSGVDDEYALYNKPAGLMHWLDAIESAEYILLLEADMLLRGPIDCAAMGVRPGTAASARYDYLVGASNGMARAFIKNHLHVQPVGGCGARASVPHPLVRCAHCLLSALGVW